MLTFGLTFLTLAGGAGAGSSNANPPMAIFEPFVGDWSCTEKIEGSPARVSDFRFTLDHQLLRETIVVPKIPSKPQGEATSAAFGFDDTTGRYSEIEMISGAHWYASTAIVPTDGSLFTWIDAATSETTVPLGNVRCPRREPLPSKAIAAHRTRHHRIGRPANGNRFKVGWRS